MNELEQAVGQALLTRLIAMGMSRETMARRMPQAVITERGAGFVVGYLSWRDDNGMTLWGPTVEVTQSRPQAEDRLIADFATAVADSVSLPA